MPKLLVPTIKSLPTEFRKEGVLLLKEGTDRPLTWLDVVVDKYSEGGTDEEVIAKLRITKKVFGQLLKDDLLFYEVVQHGRMCAYAWWLACARDNLLTKGFNTSLWSFWMKNRFSWADKQDQTIGERRPDGMSTDAVNDMFDERLVELEKQFRKKLS